MITVPSLIAAGIAPTQAKAFAEPLGTACARFGIDTPIRQAAFVAQCAHESTDFSQLEEGLYYRTPDRIRQMWPTRFSTAADASRFIRNPQGLANHVYANRNGNGDEVSGDGWRYRGRGLIQLTGRANYLAAGAALSAPYKDQPELVAQPVHAALSGAWFFVTAGCLPLADASNTDAITRKVNGPGMAGAGHRRQRFEDAARAFA